MRKYLLLLMLSAIGLASVAQQPPVSRLDINNVNAAIWGDGSCLSDDGHSGYGPSGAYYEAPCPIWEVPAGSGKVTIFQHALWFGGKDANEELHLAGMRYNQGPNLSGGRDYWMGPLKTADGSTDIMTVLKYHRIWNLTRAEIDQFVANHGNAGYQIPDDILTWPAHGDEGYAANLAPFVDVNNDGRYNPADGDYPDIKGDQCLFFIFNDNFGSHTESLGTPVGLEVHGMVYGFNAPDNEDLNNSVFVNYKLFNRSGNDYDSTYIGLFTDWDLGYERDDYVGCDVQHNTSYAYNGCSVDGNGEPYTYGENPPAQLVTVLSSPDNLGMTGFMYFTNGMSPTGDPECAGEYYMLMQSRWKDGNHVQYGGCGYPGTEGVTDSECNYMFPGDTDPQHQDFSWTEGTAGNQPGDRRGVASVGPFDFSAGAMKELDYAIITVWGHEAGPMAPVSRIGEVVDHIKALFDNGFTK